MIRALLLLCFIGTGALAQSVHETSAGPVQITPIVTRLIEPWAVGFVPGGGLLITERSGRLLYGSDGQLSSVSGVPEVWARGQGGLLDVVVARDFATTSEVFLSFSEPDGNGASGTALVEADDGTLFLTIGDRQARDQAQDTMRHNGSVIRVNRDGSIPSDNPFAADGGLPEIWSYGHRNAQGAALNLNGQLWIVEHGAQGGDEILGPLHRAIGHDDLLR